jgi:Transglutaminase-like superfamily
VSDHRIFRSLWWLSNALLIVTIATTAWTGVREYSVRQYLKGFSDAIIPEASSPQQKAEAILSWMRLGPPRLEAANTADLSPHDPVDTLNYRQLLEVCGSATNAFLNLSRSSGLQARRLLLLTPERTTKHVVAEVLLDGKWVIADATYRIFLKDPQGNYLTRQDLKNPEVFRTATSLIPGYVQIYSYENFAHVRIPALPMHGFYIRRTLDGLLPELAPRTAFLPSLFLLNQRADSVFPGSHDSGLVCRSPPAHSTIPFAYKPQPRHQRLLHLAGDKIARVRNLRIRLRLHE